MDTAEIIVVSIYATIGVVSIVLFFYALRSRQLQKKKEKFEKRDN